MSSKLFALVRRCRYHDDTTIDDSLFASEDEANVLSSAIMEDSLPSDSQWSTSERLYSNGAYELVMQPDGNLVEYFCEPIWHTKTGFIGSNNGANNRLVLQSNGDLTVYDGKNAAIWSSNTSGKGTAPYLLVVEDNGTLSLYDAKNTQFQILNN